MNKFIFRVDASIQIGTGHVMRCLTLANELSREGWSVGFICRPFKGDLINYIESKGHVVHRLKNLSGIDSLKNISIKNDPYINWLGVSQEQDAKECNKIIETIKPDWLIVDHYAIDRNWENLVRKQPYKIMVIDDLANRQHDCDILLDQNLGADKSLYSPLIPKNCKTLLGSKFSLLRSEFLNNREASIKRRNHNKIKRILVNFGGIDKENYTLKVLERLDNIKKSLLIDIVMGGNNPHLDSIKKFIRSSSNNMCLHIKVENMAELMKQSDMAIGACGSTSWERCCLGLPALIIPTAKNQLFIAKALGDNNCAILLEKEDLSSLEKNLLKVESKLVQISDSCTKVCDGKGASRVVNFFKQLIL